LLAGNHTIGNDSKLRQELATMVTKGEAEVVETMVCASKRCHKSAAESLTDFSHPTAYEPPETPPTAGSEGADEPTGRTPSAWNPRPLGTSLEAEPNFSENSGAVDV
jgi:hypothetical protein